MSVMNGFESELRGRILALIPHGFVDAPDGRLHDWQPLADDVPHTPGLLAAAPYVGGSAMVAKRGPVRGVQLWAIDTQYERACRRYGRHIVSGTLRKSARRRRSASSSAISSRAISTPWWAMSIDVILPQVTVTPMGVFPRQKRFRRRRDFSQRLAARRQYRVYQFATTVSVCIRSAMR